MNNFLLFLSTTIILTQVAVGMEKEIPHEQNQDPQLWKEFLEDRNMKAEKEMLEKVQKENYQKMHQERMKRFGEIANARAQGYYEGKAVAEAEEAAKKQAAQKQNNTNEMTVQKQTNVTLNIIAENILKDMRTHWKPLAQKYFPGEEITEEDIDVNDPIVMKIAKEILIKKMKNDYKQQISDTDAETFIKDFVKKHPK